MAATVELKVNVDASKALASLDDVYKKAALIDGKTLNLKVNVDGLNQLSGISKESTQALNALARLAKAEADLAKQEAKVRVEEERTKQARAKHKQATDESTGSTQQNTGANKQNASSLREVGDAAEKSGKTVGAFAHTLISNLAHRAINAVVRSFREALGEMKDVDTQLVNISKVSGITGKALEEMGDRAYDTASKYGVAASEYLSSVYTFQKAGLGDSSEAMGELAVKTMLVGDTTADVASQFLISANAAWKLGGNIEELNQLVDEADYINNNYATDLEKLSSGLPRVASIAAQAGMSYSETLAALGTITAVTQESGTKAATALRALILNIEGQIGTFVDDTGEEFEVTEESVKSMQGLMEKYAQAELEAARASGELINPMTAIKAIFDGMKNSDLNDQELFQLLSGMGGKLRTNQLTALVQNWELFDEMLQNTANSAGTADKEIGLMMEGWERKVQVLKNTWTQFIANIVSTDTVKKAVEDLTSFIDGLNVLFTSPADAAKKEWESAAAELKDLEDRAGSLTGIEERRLEILRLETAELENQYKKEIEREAQKSLRQATKFEQSHAENFEGESPLEVFRRDYENYSLYADKGDLNKFTELLKGTVDFYGEYYENLKNASEAGLELNETQKTFIGDYEAIRDISTENIVGIEKYNDQVDALINSEGEVVGFVKNYEAAQEAATQTQKEGIEAQEEAAQKRKETWENFIEILANAGSDITGIKTGAEEIDFSSATQSAENLTAALLAASDAAASISVGNLGGGGLISGAFGAIKSRAAGGIVSGGGPTLVNEIGPELISYNGQAFIANGGKPAVVNLGRGAIVIPADQTQVALRGGFPVRAAKEGLNTAGGWLGNASAITTTSSYTKDGVGLGALTTILTGLHGTEVVSSTSRVSRKKDSGGNKTSTPAAPAGPTIEELAKSFKDTLSNLDKQAKLANNQGDYLKEVQIYEQAQEAIKKMVDDYRKAGYKDDSDEILDLLNKNYEYANKQLSLYQTKWDELIKALQADTDAQEMANKLAEKQQAVEDAREALANAQKQRTIRMYNAATGQWEWVADEKQVSSAEEKLSKAEEAYADEVKSQAVKELQAMRDTVADLNNVILGPALSSVVTMAENSDEFQNFARALNAVYGIGSYLTSTEGNPKAISTADSHDTVYTFGNVTLTEEQASYMSVAQLAQKLSVLKIS